VHEMNRYLVVAIRNPEFQPSIIESHHAFLDHWRQQGKIELSGPFTDKSGGAYIVKAENFQEAQSLVLNDPIHTTNSATVTIYEWSAK